MAITRRSNIHRTSLFSAACVLLVSVTYCTGIELFALAPPPTTIVVTRPEMPASFDRATVAQLLADIDQPRNASALKVGYFLRRGQPPLPLDEGFELLQAAALAEPVGTNKWFRLQNLRAFAAFRVPGVNTSQGFEAYQAIFEHAAEAAPAGAGYSLRQSILEFVDSVPGKFNDFGLSKNETTKELLLKAWTAYATALGAPLGGAQIAEPNWSAALKKSESLEAFVPAVERVLDDDKVPKSFALLVTSATVLAPQKPDKAIALLVQAKPLLPKVADKLDINQGARLYQPLVDLLSAQDRLSDAIAAQREWVQLSGYGQARLMLLLRKSGDGAATERALASLILPNVDEREVTQAASALFKLARDAKAPDAAAAGQAVTLLQSYLAAARPRELEAELGARRSLGIFYFNGKQWNEANAVLTFDAPAPDARVSPGARSRLRDIERLKTQLQKHLDAAPK